MSRLPDRLGDGLEVLLVGINPGLRSAALGHHFAGRNNRFWRLLHEAGLTPRLLSFTDDVLLPGLGIGLTNIAARPTRSSSDLEPRDFERGARALARKIRRWQPRCVAFVGVTAYREFVRRAGARARRGALDRRAIVPAVSCGLQEARLERTAVFVLPNPSGRNAHFPYREMLGHFRALASWLGTAHARAS